MPLLRMRNASFACGDAAAGPVTLEISAGERAALALESEREASIVALLAAGIVKASSGQVLIDEYDPRVQSVHCKRIAAFVPHEPFPAGEADLAGYVAYRAALWNVDAKRALALARCLRERLEGMHEAFLLPLVGALIAGPRLIVIDRPQPAYASQILAAAGECAVVSTHASAAAAQRFAP
jgi:hypothetical protein